MGDTTIEWTTKTWNPTRGCALVSEGCKNCYAMGQAHRFSGKAFEGLTKKRVRLGPVWTGEGRLVPAMLALPFTWKKPEKVFVNSMSDLFFEKFTNEEIAAVFGVMASLPRHTFQILTKRARRMREWFEWWAALVDDDMGLALEKMFEGARDRGASKYIPEGSPPLELPWPLPNVHIGTSVENQETADERISHVLRVPAAVRFVSYEPALGPVDFTRLRDDHLLWSAIERRNPDAVSLDWIIVGGESGPRARPFDVAWARSVVKQCRAAGVAVFCKQLGSKPVGLPTLSGGTPFPPLKSRKGGDPSEWPEDLRVRQYPEARS